MYKLIGLFYELVGKLLLSRRCYFSKCNNCGYEVDQYYPSSGAFIWEREYWKSYQAPKCCCCGQQQMIITRSIDGLSGALYRLPGYKTCDEKNYRNQLIQAVRSGKIQIPKIGK